MKKFLLLMLVAALSFTGCEELMNGLGGLTGGEGIAFSVESVEADGDGGTYEVVVTSVLAWKATTTNNWITLETAKGGTGQNYLTFKVAKNTTTSPRTGTITVACEGLEVTAELTVNQAAGSKDSDADKLTFDFNVTDITATGATVSVEPSDKKEYYYWDIFDARMVEQYGSVAVVVEAYYDYLKAVVESGQFTWTQLLYQGNDSWAYSELTPATEYIIYTIHMDANGNILSKNYYTESFTTESRPESGISTFDISVGDITPTSANVTVYPSDANALYLWDVATKAQFDSFGAAGYAQAYYDMVKEYVDAGLYTWSNIAVSGQSSYLYERLTPDTEFVVFAYQLDSSYNILDINNVTTTTFTTPQQAQNNNVAAFVGEWQLTSSMTYCQRQNAQGKYEEEFLNEPLTRVITIEDSGDNDGTVLVYGWDGYFLNDAPALGVVEGNVLHLLNEILVYNDGQGTMYQWLAQSEIPALGSELYFIGGQYPAFSFVLTNDNRFVGEPSVGEISAGDFKVKSFTIWPVVGEEIYVWNYSEPVYTFAGDVLEAVKIDATRSAMPKVESKKINKIRATQRFVNAKASVSRFSSAVRFAAKAK